MNASNIQSVIIVGAGASGQQIAAQFARFGYRVAIYDVDEGRLADCRRRLRTMLADLVSQSILGHTQLDEILERISYSTDPATAAAEADLLSECTPESIELKRTVFRQFHPLCKPTAIFTTNTSYLLPSSLVSASGRPERFAAFHFHVPVWYANAVDVMPHRRTLPEVVDTLCELARQIGQVPILSRRENPGYVFNTLLQPLLLSAINLVARDVAEFQDVDRAWMTVMKTPVGPFGILDQIGLDTVQQIVQHSGKWLSENQKRRAASLLGPYLQQGRQGEKSGRGFYEYPDPEYRSPDFLPGHARHITTRTAPTKQRLIPVLVPAPVSRQIRHRLNIFGRVILWSSGRTADTVRKGLERAGAEVCRVPEHLPTDSLTTWLADQWCAAPAPHLCLVPCPSEERPLSQAASDRQFARRLEQPFLLTQAWFQNLLKDHLLDRATLLAVLQSGGSLGFCGPLARPEDGALPGLVKAVSLESLAHAELGIRAKIVDFPAGFTSEQCAEVSLHELALAQSAVVTGDRAEQRRRHADIEVGYWNGQRHVVRYQHEPSIEPGNGDRPPRGVWLVSGGGGGITLCAAIALARRYDLQLHMLGRTPLPTEDYLHWSPQEIETLKAEVMKTAYRQTQKPNVAWERYEKGIRLQRSMDLLRQAQIPATYHACDVSDGDSVARVVASIRREGNEIRGILHGAGVEHTCRFELKTTEALVQTLAPKLDGARALAEATRHEPLEWFIAFGSLAGRFGGIGQVDYVIANAMMAQFLRQFADGHPTCRCVTIHWPGWQEVGMAARPESRFMLQRAHLRLMPTEEGLEHLLREIEMGAPAREVVIADPSELGPEFLVERARE